MRNAFARAMTELAQERDDVCLLSGDIGNRMFDRYKEVAPTRFLNCGIAEANMMSMAAGMGLSGLKPVVYTITPFITTRCLEQIRIGVAYHETPVVINGQVVLPSWEQSPFAKISPFCDLSNMRIFLQTLD